MKREKNAGAHYFHLPVGASSLLYPLGRQYPDAQASVSRAPNWAVGEGQRKARSRNTSMVDSGGGMFNLIWQVVSLYAFRPTLSGALSEINKNVHGG